MITSTFGEIMIVIGGLAALGLLEGVFVYAVARPAWKHLPAAPPAGKRISAHRAPVLPPGSAAGGAAVEGTAAGGAAADGAAAEGAAAPAAAPMAGARAR